MMHVTSYNEDYKWPERTGGEIKQWSKEELTDFQDVKRDDPTYRNSETLEQLTKECLPPFNYFLHKKPILQTNPQEPFVFPNIPEDDGSARLTRPRVYKAPEISLDDIKDPDIRDKIIEYTYSTTWGIASKDAATRVTKRNVPDSVWELPDHVTFNKKDSVDKQLCSITSIKELEEWDKVQSRHVADPTMSFWHHHRLVKPVKIMDHAAIDIKSPEYTEKILAMARGGCLRLPYSLKPSCNYAGHMPDFPLEIEPKKFHQHFSDPMISVYQLSNRWLEQ